MTSIIIYSILLSIYLTISLAVRHSLPPESVKAWYKKVAYYVFSIPAIAVNLISTVLSVKLAGESVFTKLINWLST
jgi:hypothetical protein